MRQVKFVSDSMKSFSTGFCVMLPVTQKAQGSLEMGSWDKFQVPR